MDDDKYPKSELFLKYFQLRVTMVWERIVYFLGLKEWNLIIKRFWCDNNICKIGLILPSSITSFFYDYPTWIVYVSFPHHPYTYKHVHVCKYRYVSALFLSCWFIQPF